MDNLTPIIVVEAMEKSNPHNINNLSGDILNGEK